MDDGGLDPGLREDRLDRLGEATEPVDAADQDVLDAARAQVVEHRQPRARALALLPPDPQDLALAVGADPDRQLAAAVLDRAAGPHLDYQGVEVDDRVELIRDRCRHSATSSRTASVTLET